MNTLKTYEGFWGDTWKEVKTIYNKYYNNPSYKAVENFLLNVSSIDIQNILYNITDTFPVDGEIYYSLMFGGISGNFTKGYLLEVSGDRYKSNVGGHTIPIILDKIKEYINSNPDTPIIEFGITMRCNYTSNVDSQIIEETAEEIQDFCGASKFRVKRDISSGILYKNTCTIFINLYF